MSRPPRIEVPGGYFHVFARGNERRPIFVSEADFSDFRKWLGIVVQRYGWRVITFCQLGNHFHALVRTPRPTLSAGMRLLNGAYAQGFNRRRGRVGHVFQGRFKAVLVQDGEHLLAEIRYIVRNPLRTRRPVHPAVWPHASHRAALGLVPAPAFLDLDGLLALFGPTKAVARERYRAFVEDGDSPPPAHPLVVGDAEFVAQHAGVVMPNAEFPHRHGVPPPPLGELLAAPIDAAAIAAANRQHGYSMRQIASFLGCGIATVSRRISAYESGRTGRT